MQQGGGAGVAPWNPRKSKPFSFVSMAARTGAGVHNIPNFPRAQQVALGPKKRNILAIVDPTTNQIVNQTDAENSMRAEKDEGSADGRSDREVTTRLAIKKQFTEQIRKETVKTEEQSSAHAPDPATPTSVPVVTSISAESFDELTDECCCAICSEMFDAKYLPRNLDCGHVFCEVCIYNPKMLVNNGVKCPMCERVTELPIGRVLPINYTVKAIADKLTKSRVDPKITCKACENKFSTSAVRMCNKQGCDMFNQLLCLSCAVDGDHGGHLVKYEVMLAKIRSELRGEVAIICTQMADKKKGVLGKAKELAKITAALEKTLSGANIPAQIIGQMDTIASEQDADDLREIIIDLAATLMNGCDALEKAFDHAINTANQQFEILEVTDAQTGEGEDE